MAAPAAAEETIWCRTLGVDQGLSQSFITAIVQDRVGFMWFGTLSGLNRWDGYQFETYSHDHDEPDTLSDSGILALHVDGRGRLWVGTNRGLDRFDPATKTFERFEAPVSEDGPNQPAHVEAIASDQAGGVWFASFAEDRLKRLDPDLTGRTVHPLPAPQDAWITALHVDRSDRLWIATFPSRTAASVPGDRECRVFVLDRCSEVADGTATAPRLAVVLPTDGDRVVEMIEDGKGRLWLGRGSGGVLCFDPADGNLRRVPVDAANPAALTHSPVRGMTIGPEGGLWVLTHPGIPGASDGGSRLHRVTPDTLAIQRVDLREELPRTGGGISLERLAVDHSGVLWIGSNAGGLKYADVGCRGFAVYRQQTAGRAGLDRSYVRAICKGRDGVLWVGTPLGLNRIDRSAPGFDYRSSSSSPGWVSFPDPNVQAICEDRQGNLWIGTGGGVVAFDPGTGQARCYQAHVEQPGSISDNYVQVIHEDARGRLWFGTLGRGLNLYDDATDRFTHFRTIPDDPTTLPNETVNALCSDRRGRLWVGTDGGLAWLNPSAGEERQFHQAQGLAGMVVLSICEDRRGEEGIWVGTAQRGLCRLDIPTGSCRFFDHSNSGMPDNTVYGVLEDRQGRLWLSTNRGLVCHDPAAGTFRTYGVERGLQSAEFNGRAYFLAADGEMFFGGIGGLNSFYPEQITDNENPPRIVLTGVSVTDRRATDPESAAIPIPFPGPDGRRAEVTHRYRDLTFDFLSLHFSDPAGNRCEYRLDDYDADWHSLVSQRRVRYTNLDPGAYTLRVRAVSSHGVRSLDEATFSFVVLPPFYATGWFRGLAGLLVFSGVVGGHRLRVRVLHRRQQLLETQVTQRTTELREALETVERQAAELRELDSAKSKFFASISHEFRTPLMLTLGPLDDVRSGFHGSVPERAQKAIDLALRSTRRQLELVDQLLMLARLEAGQLEFRPRELHLDEFLRETSRSFESLARQQGIRFAVELPPVAVPGSYDEGQLEQVVGNLLGNAFKFTPAGGTVALRLTTSPDGWALIEIRDSGPGIPPADLPHMFERFYRGEQAAGQLPGTGIGLAVARECVELHGGTIQAENLPGGGSCFRVHLKTSASAHG